MSLHRSGAAGGPCRPLDVGGSCGFPSSPAPALGHTCRGPTQALAGRLQLPCVRTGPREAAGLGWLSQEPTGPRQHGPGLCPTLVLITTHG